MLLLFFLIANAGDVDCSDDYSCGLTSGSTSYTCDGDGCTVDCSGYYACEGTTFTCTGQCTVKCGDNACSGAKFNLDDDSILNCNGEYSCKAKFWISNSGTTNMTCTGDSSCGDIQLNTSTSSSSSISSNNNDRFIMNCIGESTCTLYSKFYIHDLSEWIINCNGKGSCAYSTFGAYGSTLVEMNCNGDSTCSTNTFYLHDETMIDLECNGDLSCSTFSWFASECYCDNIDTCIDNSDDDNDAASKLNCVATGNNTPSPTVSPINFNLTSAVSFEQCQALISLYKSTGKIYVS